MVRISASIGIATTPEVKLELEQLLACADAALYRSKHGGKARVTFCTTEDIENVQLAA
jgi:diguanylate cyclase (GGDEF)-like protein